MITFFHLRHRVAITSGTSITNVGISSLFPFPSSFLLTLLLRLPKHQPRLSLFQRLPILLDLALKLLLIPGPLPRPSIRQFLLQGLEFLPRGVEPDEPF